MIKVNHSRGSYEVSFAPITTLPSDAYVVTDENVDTHWGHLAPAGTPKLALPPGERTKSLIWLERTCSWLAEQGASRGSTVIALGGGVIGDLVGFAAATYMRGINYVQIPTTLLAQVDSSVGGKVAVDIPEGKNLIGAFHPPTAVIVEVQMLSTLNLRQFRNGMAEICKTGLIMDRALAEELRTTPAKPKDDRLEDVIARCIRHKADVVQKDEFETTGLRATLNFGHTVGHAIEQLTGYGPILHGEAISIGMVAETRLGEALGVTPKGTTDCVRELLTANGLPTESDILRDPKLVEIMRRDKKAQRGNLAFSLLTEIGGCKLVQGVEANDVLRVLQEV